MDYIEIVKYWQSQLVALVLSGFYWGVALGIGIAAHRLAPSPASAITQHYHETTSLPDQEGKSQNYDAK